MIELLGKLAVRTAWDAIISNLKTLFCLNSWKELTILGKTKLRDKMDATIVHTHSYF